MSSRCLSLAIILVAMVFVAWQHQASASASSLHSNMLAAKIRQRLGRHKRSLDPHAIRRVMAWINHFGEPCQDNCTAANIAINPLGPTCELQPPRVVELGAAAQDGHNDVINSPILSQDEKAFFQEYSYIFELDTEVSAAANQFPSDEHFSFFYDPTRYPPIYTEWHCSKRSTGTEEACHMPSKGNTSTPLEFGVCRYVCGKTLVLRQVKKTGTCNIPSAGPNVDSTYTWAFCIESIKRRVFCADTAVSEVMDLECDGGNVASETCHTFNTFASSR